MGFPIRKSPDRRLFAPPRSLSQLITSFIAYLRQGIHTHALSSLTIKSTTHTTERYSSRLHTCVSAAACVQTRILRGPDGSAYRICMPVKYSIVKDLDCVSNRLSGQAQRTVELLFDSPPINADERRKDLRFPIYVHPRLSAAQKLGGPRWN